METKQAINPVPDRLVVRHTASSLLAKFLPNQRTEHKMSAAAHTLRTKAPVSYAESDESADSPIVVRTAQYVVSSEEEAEDDEIIYTDRTSSGGHSLRARKSLNQSLKAYENGYTTPISVSLIWLILLLSYADKTSLRTRSPHTGAFQRSHSMGPVIFL